MLQLVTALIRDLQIEAFVFHCTIDMFAFVQEGKIFFVWAYHSTTDGYPAFNKHDVWGFQEITIIPVAGT